MKMKDLKSPHKVQIAPEALLVDTCTCKATYAKTVGRILKEHDCCVFMGRLNVNAEDYDV